MTEPITDERLGETKARPWLELRRQMDAFGSKGAEWLVLSIIARLEQAEMSEHTDKKFPLGTRVRKVKGSSWQGRVVGFYSTSLTPVGYAVESEREPGSVQIYPESALERVQD